MKKLFAGVAAVSLAILPLSLISQSAKAGFEEFTILEGVEGLTKVKRWTPGRPVCGEASVFPVLMMNTTSVPQTASITIAPQTTAQVRVGNTQQEAIDQTDCLWSPKSYWTAVNRNITVQPGMTKTIWMSIGGRDYNLIEAPNSFGFGGLPGGTPGQSWYQFQFKLNMKESFESLWAVYGGTGGGDSNNSQNGFNIRNCIHTVDADGTASTQVGATVTSPWKKSGGFTTFPSGSKQPVCVAWGWGS